MTASPFKLLARLILATCLLLTAPMLGRASAESGDEIDARVNSALTRFRKSVKGADEFLASAKGVLIVPEVKKAGLIVAGQWGTGALQVGGKRVDYYKMEGGSAGIQAGYQKSDFVFLFLTENSLAKFRHGDDWAIGTDAEITVVDKGAALSADTLKSSKPVMAFVYGEEGLMAGWSAKGTKFRRFTPKD